MDPLKFLPFIVLLEKCFLTKRIFLFSDLTLKVWRIFPFASEALAPLFMFMHQTPVTHLRFAYHSLGVVYQDSSKSLHSFSMFNTKNTKSG